ncbi:MAG: hypothetical protein AAF802_01505 [Planctomycetota bacterium]
MARILFLDDNVRNIGGHYLELADLLATGAIELGYQAELIANKSYSPCRNDSRLRVDDRLKVHAEFDVRRMETWSLGVDGSGRCLRESVTGGPLGTTAQRLRQTFLDRVAKSRRRPRRMLDRWSEVFSNAVRRFDPTHEDSIVVNTGCDFQMLALSQAIKKLAARRSSLSLNISVLFHFAVFDGRIARMAIDYGRQVNSALQEMSGHQVNLFATTEKLADQLRFVGVSARAVPYPTRVPLRLKNAAAPAPKVMLAGIPRAEKGRHQIRTLINEIEPNLRQRIIRLSMQLPAKRWQRFVPSSALELCNTGEPTSAIECVFGNQTDHQYHSWIDGADIGLFLYDPDRYVARCSGVLLEMLSRGIPVIVPTGCWLSDKVDEAPDRIGWVYENASELPTLIRRASAELDTVRINAIRHAASVANTHNGVATLRAMGIQNRVRSASAA